MNILLVGSGGREHAIANALHRSTEQPRIFCCGTQINPSIEQMAYQYWTGDITDVAAITNLAKQWQIGLAIIGPEAPLEKGLADALWQAAIPTIGPKKKLAQIETSKAFARELMQKYHIPGLPRYRVFQQFNGIEKFLTELGEGNYVVKANGLMSGKGVKVSGEHLPTLVDALAYCNTVLAQGHPVVIEEKLIGQEFSFMAFCDGEYLIPMPIVQDHKRAFVGDQGPNTGGMGSYSDADHRLPFLTEADVKDAWQINEAVVRALTTELNDKYVGILYGSFIATQKGIYVIEFNARFGDPEALNVLTILESDFVTICRAMVTGSLSAHQVQFARQATVCKYVVPQGYPDAPVKNVPIDLSAVKNKAYLYLAGVYAVDGQVMLTESRAAAYVGVASHIPLAEKIAEKEICSIVGPLSHRADIGTEALIQYYVDRMRKLRQL